MPRGRLLALAASLLLASCAPRYQPPGPAGLEGRLLAPELVDGADGERFQTADGRSLPLRSWWPIDAQAARPRAVIAALHGMNDYGNAFAAPAAAFARRGVVTYAPDQRGFGAGPLPGLWPGIDLLASDIRALARLLRARHPNVPLYLLGESMGGAVSLVALASAEPPDVDGAILVGPAVWGRAFMPRWQAAALDIAVSTLPWVSLAPQGLNIKPSDNLPMLRAFARDPLVIKETRIDAIAGLVDLMDAAIAAAPRVAQPLLLLYGERDELVPRGPTIRLIETLPAVAGTSPRQRVAIYPDGYHMLLRDERSKTPIADILAWIEDPAGVLPSGADRRGDPVEILKRPPPRRGW
ncbi:MAG: lysophospholipase [Alphaproteobacteria bacterium]|nr:lysophospholipase [Alphaproteobacteria bacterium]